VDYKRRRATIEQVARLAGVSTTTVSNVFNDRTSAMRPATRQRVLDSAQVLGYHPSQAARSLANRQTATLGLVIAEIATPLFFGAVSVIEHAARDAGYNVLLCHASTPAEETQALDLLQEKDVEGVVFLSTSDYRDEGALLRFADSVPVVTINRSGYGGSFARVAWDNVQGMVTAVRHLHQLGHGRIAFLRGPADRQGSDERFQGYRFGLAECGLPFVDELVATGDYTAGADDWRRSAEVLLAASTKPTAVIASDDSVAAAVIKTVQDHGMRVPGDIAVIGVDDQPFAPLLNPSLTTVRLPIVEAGQAAIGFLLDRFHGDSAASARVMLPMTLVVRESCGARQAAATAERIVSA